VPPPKKGNGDARASNSHDDTAGTSFDDRGRGEPLSGRQTAPNPIKLLSYAEMVALPEGEFLIQGVYDATVEERSYLQKLSHTYVLLLLLKNEPRIVEYFKSLSSKFVLYVGTDFLVRALSAQCLLLAQGLGAGGTQIIRKLGESRLTPKVFVLV
jgi:hypothetical protein